MSGVFMQSQLNGLCGGHEFNLQSLLAKKQKFYTTDGPPMFIIPLGKYNYKSAVKKGPNSSQQFSRLITQMFLRLYASVLLATLVNNCLMRLHRSHYFSVCTRNSVGIGNLPIRQLPGIPGNFPQTGKSWESWTLEIFTEIFGNFGNLDFLGNPQANVRFTKNLDTFFSG